MILKYVFPSQMIIFFFRSYHHRKWFSQSVLCWNVALLYFNCCVGFAFTMDLLLHGD
jgi:hypothetical protein